MIDRVLPKSAYLFFVALTFVATVLVYVSGTALQVLNLPFGLMLTSLLVFGAAGLFFPTALNVSPLRFTGINRATASTVGLAALIGFVNIPLANYLMGIFTELMPSYLVDMAKAVSRLFLAAAPTSRVLLIVAAAVAAPIGEELFFRGWLQTALTRRMRQVTSVFVTAVLFSLIHGDPVGFVARVELGVLFGLARVWTGSLWPAVAMHAVHNFVSIMALYLADNPALEIDKPFDPVALAPVAVGSLVFVVGGLFVLRALSPKQPEEPLVPLLPAQPTFTPAARLATTFATVTVALLLASGAVLYAFRDTLPGHDLKLSALEQPTAPTLPQPVDSSP